MYDFTGCECPVCHQRLRPDDDMVVCPDCGAPYHRACYEKTGHCVYQAQHGTGFEWAPPEPVAQAPASRVCAVCGTSNPADNQYCKNCGAPLTENAPRPPRGAQSGAASPAGQGTGGAQFDYSRLYNNTYTPPSTVPFGAAGYEIPAVDPNENLEGIPAAEWAAYIGRSSRNYLLVFKQMELLRRKISFSFSAMLFGPFYFFYRKAWKPALIFAGLMLLVDIPTILSLLQITESPLVAGLSTSVLNGLVSAASVLNFATMIVRGLFGFYLYKKDAAARIRRIRAAYPDAQQRSYVLSAQGGTSIGAALGFLAAIFVFYLLVEQFLMGPNIQALFNLLQQTGL